MFITKSYFFANVKHCAKQQKTAPVKERFLELKARL